MNNLTGSFCDSGNYSFIDNNNNSHIFDSKLPIYHLTDNMANLLNVKNDLIDYLENDIIVLQDNTDSDILKNIQEFIIRGNSLRDELKVCEKNYEEYRIKIKNNIDKINAFLDFVTKLNDIPSDHYKLLKESIDILIEDTNESDKLNEIKTKYTTSKANYMKYLNELLHINNVNIGNKCSICLTHIVSNYYNPCGHTICESCDKFDNNSSININDNCNRCPICRSNINERRKLFFI
jgi:hypothetical protein